jgi:diguanylate cyclase (GGDEF)-like protein
MQLSSISREELQDITAQLEQTIYNHQQWYNAIIRTLICRLPPDRHDTNQKAHEECRFGQWYYEAAPKKLRKHPGFTALGEEHLKMHQEAAKLLQSIEQGTAIDPYEYDNFANALEKMRLEISALQRELNILIYSRDVLTGAINRVNMLPLLREQQAMVQRNMQSCSLVMVDIDYFKKINDKYGHAAGDCVLAWVSHFFIEHLRAYDKIFRVGGEEFLLCLPSADSEAAFDILERLRAEIASSKIGIHKGKSAKITISVGIASIKADVSIEDTMEQADKALYKAKSEGRNCVRVW